MRDNQKIIKALYDILGISIKEVSKEEIINNIKVGKQGNYLMDGVPITVNKYNQIEPSNDEII